MKTINDMALTDWTETKRVLTGMQLGLSEAGHYPTPIKPIIPTQDADVEYVLKKILTLVNEYLVPMYPDAAGSIKEYIGTLHYESAERMGVTMLVQNPPNKISKLFSVLFNRQSPTATIAMGSAGTMFIFATQQESLEGFTQRCLDIFEESFPWYLHGMSWIVQHDRFHIRSWLYWNLLYSLYTAIRGLRARGIVPQDTTWEWLAPVLYQDWMQHLTDRATRDTIWEHIVNPRDEDVWYH